MKQFNYCYGILMIIMASLAFYLSGSFMNLGGYDIGPSVYPKTISIVIIILSLILLINTFFDKSLSKNLSELFRKYEFLRVLGGLILFILYFASMDFLGFFIATLAFMVLFQWILRIRSWIKISLVSILFSVSVFYVFTDILYIDLPHGILSF